MTRAIQALIALLALVTMAHAQRLSPQGGTVTSVTATTGGGVTVAGTAARPTIGLMTCPADQVLKSVGATWACGAAGATYTAGDGLALTGSDFDVVPGTGITITSDQVTLNLATTDCTPGSFFDSNTATGVFSCVAEVGDISGVTAGAGLINGGTSGAVTLDIGAGAGITVNADTIEVDTSVVFLNSDITVTANVLAKGGGTADTLVDSSITDTGIGTVAIAAAFADVSLRINNTAAGGRSYLVGSGATASGFPGEFYVYDETAAAVRLRISSAGAVTVPGSITTNSTLTAAGNIITTTGNVTAQAGSVQALGGSLRSLENGSGAGLILVASAGINYIESGAYDLSGASTAELRFTSMLAADTWAKFDVSGNYITYKDVQLGDAGSDRVGVGIAPDSNHAVTFAASTGNKIALYPVGSTQAFGFGIQSGQLQVYTDTSTSYTSIGYGDSDAFNETNRFLSVYSAHTGQASFGYTNNLVADGINMSVVRKNALKWSDALEQGVGGGNDNGFVEVEYGTTLTYATATILSPRGITETVGSITASSSAGTADYRAPLTVASHGHATTAGQAWTFSVWAKAASGTPTIGIALARYGDSGLSGTTCVLNASTWTRCTYSATLSSASLLDNSVVNAYLTFQTTTQIYFWGAQVEQNSIATPYQRNDEEIDDTVSTTTRTIWAGMARFGGTMQHPRVRANYFDADDNYYALKVEMPEVDGGGTIPCGDIDPSGCGSGGTVPASQYAIHVDGNVLISEANLTVQDGSIGALSASIDELTIANGVVTGTTGVEVRYSTTHSTYIRGTTTGMSIVGSGDIILDPGSDAGERVEVVGDLYVDSYATIDLGGTFGTISTDVLTGVTSIGGPTIAVGSAATDDIAFSNGPRGINGYEGTHFEWVDEWLFAGGVTQNNEQFGSIWYVSSGGTGNSINPISATAGDGRPGVVSLETGTTTGGRMTLYTHASAFSFDVGDFEMNAVVSFPILSTSSEEYSSHIGFSDALATSIADGCVFVYDRANVYPSNINTGNLDKWEGMCITAAAGPTWVIFDGTGGTVDSPVVAGDWYNLVVRVSNGVATFEINGITVGTISADVPTGASRDTGAVMNILKSVGTTAREMYLDYSRVAYDLDTARSP